MKDRRIGRFRIDRFTIEERPNQARAILKDVIVIRAEYMAHSEAIEYEGIHPSFAAVGPGELAPEYAPSVTTRGDGSVDKVHWEKR